MDVRNKADIVSPSIVSYVYSNIEMLAPRRGVLLVAVLLIRPRNVPVLFLSLFLPVLSQFLEEAERSSKDEYSDGINSQSLVAT